MKFFEKKVQILICINAIIILESHVISGYNIPQIYLIIPWWKDCKYFKSIKKKMKIFCIRISFKYKDMLILT